MGNVLEVEALQKSYRRFRKPSTVAVDGLSFEVPEGGVFGFLGPNGSGKTTTIRCMLSLATQESGACRVLGKDSRHGLREVIGRVGALVEAPALFPGFSARRNLQILAKLDGIGKSRIQAVLDQVGLDGREDDLVKGYSLGMRQRLALAAALLKDPALLILDEPANGLDPSGIREVRELLRSLGQEGRTVFVSSHLLSEVQHVADRVAILSKGVCVAEGTVTDLLHAGRAGRVRLRIADPESASQLLTDKGFQSAVEGESVFVSINPNEADSIVKTLASKKMYPLEVVPDEADLEQTFLSLTEDQGIEPDSAGSATEQNADSSDGGLG